MFCMAYSLQQPWRLASIERPTAARSKKAGGRYAAGLVPQLPARRAGSVAFHAGCIDSTKPLAGAIARRYEVAILR
jgi:hypothetical protein